MIPDVTNWRPLEVEAIQEHLGSFRAWCLCAGQSLDWLLGRTTRPHGEPPSAEELAPLLSAHWSHEVLDIQRAMSPRLRPTYESMDILSIESSGWFHTVSNPATRRRRDIDFIRRNERDTCGTINIRNNESAKCEAFAVSLKGICQLSGNNLFRRFADVEESLRDPL